ncbi:MAG: DUF1801 domain-containing protein [bacterium]|nr:DUF1801 domain-containing protein [bacterium]
MAKDIHNPDSVKAYINKLEPNFGHLIQAIGNVVLATDDRIGEQIKWNSPSFFYLGDMKPFNPKEYKRDLLAINVRKEQALLVFPTGANIQDNTGVLEGNYTDGRRRVTIKTMAELKEKTNNLMAVIKRWLNQINN